MALTEYTVTIKAEARGAINVTARDEEHAAELAKEHGMEIANVDELSEFEVYEVEFFQDAADDAEAGIG